MMVTGGRELFKKEQTTYVLCKIHAASWTLLVIDTPNTKTGHTYKMLPELLSQIEKEHRSRCSLSLIRY
jgi:hypothetical protein